MLFLKQGSKLPVLLLVLLAGTLITAPSINFQDFLSQGDHGRDLYAAQAVYRGELPYKDFWWVYGPLIPYYYGLFLKIFGMHISSILSGKILLIILGGILICLGLMEITSTTTAFLCACWFMLFHQEFFFTYNHLGGIAMVLGVVWCLLTYIQKQSLPFAWGALIFTLILCLIKINFGLAALAVTIVTVTVTDSVISPDNFSKKMADLSPFYAVALLGLPLLVFIVYWSLLQGLSITEIRQCLPYMEGDQPYSVSLWVAIRAFLQNILHTALSSWANLSFAAVINGSALRCLYLLVKNKLPNAPKIILSLGMLGLFYAANFHEYLMSGVWYRGFWAQPLSMMISFLLIGIAVQDIPKIARRIFFLLLASLMIFCWWSILLPVNAAKTKNQYMPLPYAGIYVTNPPSWIMTVEQTTEFLNKTLKPHELFFALPYDCLYYYLTGRKTPTRQLIFYEHIKITEAQEKSVIAELEKNHVNYILVSSRAFMHQTPGLGLLGTDYCPLIAKYIRENFVPLKRFGDWTNPPGWAWNHGTLILKRKGVL